MRSGNDDLWKQTAELLRRRPGWVIEAVSTPGQPTYWCFARGSRAALLVQVEDNSITVQVSDGNETVAVGNAGELEAWLTVHRPDSLQQPKGTAADKLKAFRAGKLFRWN